MVDKKAIVLFPRYLDFYWLHWDPKKMLEQDKPYSSQPIDIPDELCIRYMKAATEFHGVQRELRKLYDGPNT